MTVPCGLADSTMYRKIARHSARFYALRAASGTARSLRPQARFGAQPPHSGGSWRGDRHAPYISTRKRAFSTSWVCPLARTHFYSARQGRGKPRPRFCGCNNITGKPQLWLPPLGEGFSVRSIQFLPNHLTIRFVYAKLIAYNQLYTTKGGSSYSYHRKKQRSFRR